MFMLKAQLPVRSYFSKAEVLSQKKLSHKATTLPHLGTLVSGQIIVDKELSLGQSNVNFAQF
jgi:hypothetical protein